MSSCVSIFARLCELQEHFVDLVGCCGCASKLVAHPSFFQKRRVMAYFSVDIYFTFRLLGRGRNLKRLAADCSKR